LPLRARARVGHADGPGFVYRAKVVSVPARTDMTRLPPAVLLPLFETLRRAPRPCPLALLERALAEHEHGADALGDAVTIDTAAYVRTLVFASTSLEVFVMAWLPGQRSPIHDHRGSACAVKVIAGTAIEQHYQRCSPTTVVPHGEPRMIGAGSVIGSLDADIHSLGNAAANPASIRNILVTIHAYSPPLAPTLKYLPADGT
jgi:cysteine dioxygenase